jgi:hypothetical protein
MPSTPTYGLRYPALSNSPNVPQDIQNLAEDVEDEFERVDAKIATLAKTHARVDTPGDSAMSSYQSALTGSSVCGVAFVAPASGLVSIHFATAGYNTAGGAGAENKTSIWIGEGAVVNSGAQVKAANDNDMILHVGEVAYGLTGFATIAGLTSGNPYNVVLQHKVSAGTGTWLYRRVAVIPDV